MRRDDIEKEDVANRNIRSIGDEIEERDHEPVDCRRHRWASASRPIRQRSNPEKYSSTSAEPVSAPPTMTIVGAGKAGARAALALREHGWKEPISLIGEEPLAPYDRPPLSKSAIIAETTPEPAFILDASMLASLNVSFIAGVGAVEILRREKSIRLADGRRLPYHRLLLATGARARRLPRAEHARTLRDLGDSRALHADLAPGRRVVVIGGGFIGLELAASASTRGCSVTVIEIQPRILMRGVCATIAAAVDTRHAAAGVSDCFRRKDRPRGARRGRGCRTGGNSRPISSSRASAPFPKRRSPKPQGWRSTTASPVMQDCAPAIPISSPPAIAARFRTRFSMTDGSGSRPGAPRQTRVRSRRRTCWAATAASRRCRGSGPINMSCRCRSRAYPTRAPRRQRGG